MRSRALLAALGLCVGLQVAVAFWPYRLDLPRQRENAVVRLPEGGLRFVPPSIARTAAAPSWLAEAIDTGRLAVDVELRTASPDQTGPARILAVAEGPVAANLVVGQEAADLVVRVRRQGSEPFGEPALTLPGALSDGAWHHLALQLVPGALAVEWDGVRAAHAEWPGRFTETWSPEMRLALGDEPEGGRPWRGEIRSAWVETDSGRTPLLGSVETPARARYVPERLRLPQQLDVHQVAPALWHLLGFAPLGWLVVEGVSRRPVRSALLLASVLALLLLAGRTVIEGRHPHWLDVPLQVAGAGAGATIAARRRRVH